MTGVQTCALPILDATESKDLQKGTRVCWQGNVADRGTITQTSWDAVTITWDRAYPVDTHIYRTRRHSRMKGLMTMKTLATILAAAFLATILLPALLGVEAAWAGSLSNGRMPGQSQRSLDSGYCPGSKIHVYHLRNCAHLYPEDRAKKSNRKN